MKSFQPFRLDKVNQCLWRGGTRVPLMPKPFAVLQYLVEHAGAWLPTMSFSLELENSETKV
jgi:DNA-binding response OmpR family regulator